MNQTVKIGERWVGRDHPCFVVAEIGVNHNGDMALARKLIEAAAKAGADAAKFQSFIAEDLVTPQAAKADYQVVTTGESGSQYRMLKALEVAADDQDMLRQCCQENGILYLCTPYEHKSVDMLDRIDVAAYKVASTDTNNIPFLRHMASKGRPIILSTGMSSLGEVELAVNTLVAAGAGGKIIILQCTSEYPAPFGEVNLRAMATMERAFGCPVGFSDHTPGIGASPWAVALGACMIEKHFTLDRNMVGPDHRASIEPDELAELVRTVRDVRAAMGDGTKRLMPCEAANKPRMQKSLVAARDLAAGQIIGEGDVTCKRPGTGIPAAWFDKVVGTRARTDMPANTILTLSSVDWGDE